MVFCDSTPTTRPVRRAAQQLQSQQERQYARAPQCDQHRRLVAHLPGPELGHFLRPGRDGHRDRPRGPRRDGDVLRPDQRHPGHHRHGQQQLDAAGVQRLVLVLRPHRAGLRRQRQRIRHHRLPGEHRRHQPHHRHQRSSAPRPIKAGPRPRRRPTSTTPIRPRPAASSASTAPSRDRASPTAPTPA